MPEIEIDKKELRIWENVIAFSTESKSYFSQKKEERGEKTVLHLSRADIEDLLAILSLMETKDEAEEEELALFEDLLLFTLNTPKEEDHAF